MKIFKYTVCFSPAESCSGLLDENPKGDAAKAISFIDENNALSRVNDLYNAFLLMNVYTRQAMMVMEFGTDIGTRSPTDNWPTLDPIATYTHNASAERIGWTWRDGFKYIHQPGNRQYRSNGRACLNRYQRNVCWQKPVSFVVSCTST